MAYDIRKSNDQWGREYYHRDSMDWRVPVLFIPYFDWICNWNKGIKHQLMLTLTILREGIRCVWQDRTRIIRKEFYHNEE